MIILPIFEINTVELVPLNDSIFFESEIKKLYRNYRNL